METGRLGRTAPAVVLTLAPCITVLGAAWLPRASGCAAARG